MNYLKFVANRYLSYIRRLVGPIFLVYLMPLLGDGPIWHYYKQIYTTPCQKNILPSLLFYSNFANSLDEVVSRLFSCLEVGSFKIKILKFFNFFS